MPLVLNGTTGVQDNSGAFVQGTSVASTSGTSIDFTGIPSWVKRVTVMFNGVSTNGSSNYQIQIGSGSVTTSGYNSASSYMPNGSTTTVSVTSGLLLVSTTAASVSVWGQATISLISGNTWTYSSALGRSDGTSYVSSGASPNLSGALDRVRITTVNGTDTFDAGTINILYE